MFSEFEKKNTAFKHKKYGDSEEDMSDFCIAIPFKNSEGLKKSLRLDEDFIKVIEHEYATRYLEKMATIASQNAI